MSLRLSIRIFFPQYSLILPCFVFLASYLPVGRQVRSFFIRVITSLPTGRYVCVDFQNTPYLFLLPFYLSVDREPAIMPSFLPVSLSLFSRLSIALRERGEGGQFISPFYLSVDRYSSYDNIILQYYHLVKKKNLTGIKMATREVGFVIVSLGL